MNTANVKAGEAHPLPPPRGRYSFDEIISKSKNFLRTRLMKAPAVTVATQRTPSRLSQHRLTHTQARHILQYLDPGEYIEAVVRGHVPGTRNATLVATKSRLIYLHETMFSHKYEHMPYGDIGCVMLTPSRGPVAKIGIYTKTGTYSLVNVNARAARELIRSVATNPGFNV